MMARKKRNGPEIVSTQASKRGKGSAMPVEVVPEMAENVVLAYVSRVIKPYILGDAKNKSKLRQNLT
jgi:hypothetical protein